MEPSWRLALQMAFWFTLLAPSDRNMSPLLRSAGKHRLLFSILIVQSSAYYGVFLHPVLLSCLSCLPKSLDLLES